jgi:hypothetical protein
MEVGDFWLVVGPSLERSLILDRYVWGSILDVVGIVKSLIPKILRK